MAFNMVSWVSIATLCLKPQLDSESKERQSIVPSIIFNTGKELRQHIKCMELWGNLAIDLSGAIKSKD